MTEESTVFSAIPSSFSLHKETDCGGHCRVTLAEIRAAFAKRILLQCRYKESGCEEGLHFDHIKQHESKCVYRSCRCMVKECAWEGMQVDLEKHFNDKHKSLLHLNGGRFPVFGEDDTEGVQAVSTETVLFLIEYKYEPDGNLVYKISYVSPYTKTAAYVIYKEGTNLNRGVCSYLGDPDSKYEALDADSIRDCILRIKLTYRTYNSRLVDYKLIKTHKCSRCRGYLIPQPYNVQPFGEICGTCAERNNKDVVPSTQPLAENIKTAKFPCRWKFCHFVADSEKLYYHEKVCRFRLYKCFIGEVCDFMDLTELKSHLTDAHNVKYFEDKYVVERLRTSRMFTIKHNTFIVIDFDFVTEFLFRIAVKNIGARIRIPVYVQCEHDHCAIKSKVFCIVNEFRFTRQSLPPCFAQKPFTLVFTMF